MAEEKTIDTWKTLGDLHYLKKNYVSAVAAYAEGLTLYPKCVFLLSNRSATYLNMQAYESALKDANDLLEIDPSYVKGSFHKAKALSGLKKYEDALVFLDSVNKSQFLKSEQCELEKLKHKVECYLHQQKTGAYDIPHMMATSFKDRGCTFDYAEYVGPVEERPSPCKGRGLFATEDIQAGQLLISSKAFALHVSERMRKFSPERLKWTSTKWILCEDEKGKLSSLVINALKMAPEKGKDLYKLFAGQQLGFLNADEGADTTVIDKKRIEAICAFNSFSPHEIQHNSKSCEGLWLLPSMMNHSCFDCNCHMTVFGDFMLVRSLKPIAKDEEILVSYTLPCETISQRMILFNEYQFLCECQLCEIDNNERKNTYQRREQAISELAYFHYTQLRSNEVNIDEYCAKGKSVVDLVVALRAKNLKMNTYLVLPSTLLSEAYEGKKQYRKAAKVLEKAYQVTEGSAFCEDNVEIVSGIVKCYLRVRDIEEAKKWLATLRKCILILYGTLDVFYLHTVVVETNDILHEHSLCLFHEE